VERRIWKFTKGASTGEPSLAGFAGSLSTFLSAIVSAKVDSLSRGSQSRQVLATGFSTVGPPGWFFAVVYAF
jgi:hypothetical protein